MNQVAHRLAPVAMESLATTGRKIPARQPRPAVIHTTAQAWIGTTASSRYMFGVGTQDGDR